MPSAWGDISFSPLQVQRANGELSHFPGAPNMGLDWILQTVCWGEKNECLALVAQYKQEPNTCFIDKSISQILFRKAEKRAEAVTGLLRAFFSSVSDLWSPEIIWRTQRVQLFFPCAILNPGNTVNDWDERDSLLHARPCSILFSIEQEAMIAAAFLRKGSCSSERSVRIWNVMSMLVKRPLQYATPDPLKTAGQMVKKMKKHGLFWTKESFRSSAQILWEH